MAILAAVDALRAEGRAPGFNLKIVFEGEEEAGSPQSRRFAPPPSRTLRSDGWVIVDGPAHQSGPPQLSLGVRGDVNIEVSVHGPVRPLHSGHYGNWAPNPAMMLAELLASMKDETGRVTIAGFYDDVVPLTAAERAAIAAVPAPDAALRRELGLGWTEGGGAPLTELINLPSLNINGMSSADVGDGGAQRHPDHRHRRARPQARARQCARPADRAGRSPTSAPRAMRCSTARRRWPSAAASRGSRR